MSSLPIIDSRMTFAEALAGTIAPPPVIAKLCLLDVQYQSFDGFRHCGQIVIHEDVRRDVLDIFDLLQRCRFPLGRVCPIVQYGWSDDASMVDNNTSAFNYRYVAGTERLSAHASGMAVDINPVLNPVIYADGRISPSGAQYRPEREGTFSDEDPIVQEFLKRGWIWGGQFVSFKDYHHFEKKREV